MEDIVANFSLNHRGEPSVLPVATYVAEHQAALWHAARFLGGYEAALLVDQLAAALQQDSRMTAGVRSVLGRLLSLLTLEHVHDVHRPEMAYFVTIDPADPAIEEICLLTDGLRSALHQSDALGGDVAAARRKAA
jgi:hypothetical protein